MTTPKHHHGYICTQYRYRSWFTRQCAHPSCGVMSLTWQARVSVGVLIWAMLILVIALGE